VPEQKTPEFTLLLPFQSRPTLLIKDFFMNNLHDKLLRMPEVKASTGLSKSTIYARIAEGTFPKQIPPAPHFTQN